MTPRCSDECVLRWPLVLAMRLTPWERRFAEDVADRAKNAFWRPSAKQLEIMRRMVSEAMAEPAINLIER